MRGAAASLSLLRERHVLINVTVFRMTRHTVIIYSLGFLQLGRIQRLYGLRLAHDVVLVLVLLRLGGLGVFLCLPELFRVPRLFSFLLELLPLGVLLLGLLELLRHFGTLVFICRFLVLLLMLLLMLFLGVLHLFLFVLLGHLLLLFLFAFCGRL